MAFRDLQFTFRGDDPSQIMEIRQRATRGTFHSGHIFGGGGGESRDWFEQFGHSGLVAYVLAEVHAALCAGDPRYAKEVATLATNSKLLIAAIGGSVATTHGIGEGAAYAMAGTALWLVGKIGVNALCEYFKPQLPPSPGDAPDPKRQPPARG